MRRVFCCALLLATSAPVLSAEPTLRDILKNVEKREARTGAILSVRSSAAKRAEGTPATYLHFEIRIKDKTAHVEMYNNYKNGKKGESFTFPIGPEIEAEYARLQNLAQLRLLDAAVADAERRRRIFVLSSFKFEEGSRIDVVEGALGKPTSVTLWQKVGWSTLVFRDVTVVVSFGGVHDIQSKPRR